jgi:hypothetical protein
VNSTLQAVAIDAQLEANRERAREVAAREAKLKAELRSLERTKRLPERELKP